MYTSAGIASALVIVDRTYDRTYATNVRSKPALRGSVFISLSRARARAGGKDRLRGGRDASCGLSARAGLLLRGQR